MRRTACGAFTLEQAITLEALEALDPAARRSKLLAVDAPIADLPRLDLDPAAALALAQGRRPSVPGAPEGRLRAYGPEGAFLGLATAEAGTLRAVRLVQSGAASSDA